MHLKHLLATTLLALLSGSAIAQDLPNLNAGTLNNANGNGNLGLRDIPQNMGSMSGQGSESPSSPESLNPSSSTTPTPTSSMASNSPTASSSMAPNSSSSWMASSSTPSTLQSSTRPSSAMGSTTPSSSSAYPSSTPVSGSSSGSNNMLGGLLGDKGLHLRAEPTQVEGVVPGYLQPAYQPAARPT